MRRQLNLTVSCGIHNAAVGMIELDEGESKTAAVESLLKPGYNLEKWGENRSILEIRTIKKWTQFLYANAKSRVSSRNAKIHVPIGIVPIK
jgi:hypothetical protein